MKLIKIFSNCLNVFLVQILFSTLSIVTLNMRNFEEDLVIKFSSNPEYLYRDRMDSVRNKIRTRMKMLEMKANGKLFSD